MFVQKCKGILAVPNIRGGGEFGKEWHLAGTRERKVIVIRGNSALGSHGLLLTRLIVLTTSLLHRKRRFFAGGWSFVEALFSEYLVKNKYTSADRLTITGGSNGGTNVKNGIFTLQP